ncbi:MAG TPA: type II toxin-antitoxin system RelE/ParE family toxin [Candidatus Woesebacteria bacterium]|nr:type II toxin-antitoxin system RelE/ParE family toxin [Candidatus Woesebacteria bacterium]HOY61254.1 type II toxin-antitoxin system RelE/ParE family toxin [Candidatus Woesebacteria bacterium]HPR99480.1 type II toxin-antitoxin system RelE/ParE family toxin [Candidatus Woesebacteria bacterium]
MDYVILLTKNAKKDIDRLDGVIQKRVAKKLIYLKSDPINLSKALIDFEQGQYRFRVGDFRICFDIDGNKIVVNRIRHRKEVYK